MQAWDNDNALTLLRETGLWTVRQAAIELGLSSHAVKRRAEALGVGWRTADGQVVLSEEDVREIAALGKRMNRHDLPGGRRVRGRLYRQAEVARMLGVDRKAVLCIVAGLGIGLKASRGHARWLTGDEVEWVKRIIESRRKALPGKKNAKMKNPDMEAVLKLLGIEVMPDGSWKSGFLTIRHVDGQARVMVSGHLVDDCDECKRKEQEERERLRLNICPCCGTVLGDDEDDE